MVHNTLHAGGLVNSSGGSISSAQPAMTVITNGKSQRTALPGHTKEVDTEERLLSSLGEETSIAVGVTQW